MEKSDKKFISRMLESISERIVHFKGEIIKEEQAQIK